MRLRRVRFYGVRRSGCFPNVVCIDRHSAIALPNVGLRSAHIAIQYRRATTRAGELDGAKEANGG